MEKNRDRSSMMEEEQSSKRSCVVPTRHAIYFLIYVSGLFMTRLLRGLYKHTITTVLPTNGDRPVAVNITKVPLRILYVVTSLEEYTDSLDRLAHLVLPTLVDGVKSLSGRFQQVDVYLILYYKLRPQRYQLIRDRLPPSVGLEIWDDACPIGYDENEDTIIKNVTRSLARQHRFVMKDKFEHYDFFMQWEDDMRVAVEHVEYFLKFSKELDQLRADAPETLPDVPEVDNVQEHKFFGALTRNQLDHMLPGFVRVEVLLDPRNYKTQAELDPIPLTYENDKHFNPYYCCHMKWIPNVNNIPETPIRENIVIWETGVRGLSVRALPTLTNETLSDRWVALLPGPGLRRSHAEDLLHGYWSGRDGEFGPNITIPVQGNPQFIAQQGGWMARKDQMLRFYDTCHFNFLPPFDLPEYRRDGIESINVETWSGGYQIFLRCGIRRVVSLEPDDFSKHFLYHVANNKQRRADMESRRVKAEHLFGQLNTVKKRAEATRAKILGLS